MKNLLGMLARATDTKGYPDDKDPAHWRTIHHAKVHIDADGYIDGGGGERLKGKKLTSETWPHRPETYSKPKGADDLRKAWATVAKERMEVHRAKTEKSRKAHEDKLAEAYKAYTDLRAEIEARDPAEAAKFKPRTGGAAASPKGALASLVEATAPEMSAEAKGFEDHGIAAIKAYAEFKKTGSPEALQKAQDALTKATEQMDAIADPEEAKQARAAIIEECKKAGLKSDKLRDLFKEIKNAKAPAPTPAPTTPLAGMAEATTTPYTGKSKYGGCSPTAGAKEISQWRKTYPTLAQFEKHSKTRGDEIEAGFIRAGIATKEELQQFKKHLKRVLDSCDFGMMVKSSTLMDKILKPGGKFKSQFETASSGGMYNPDERARFAADLFGHSPKAKDVPKEAREKYGFAVAKVTDECYYPTPGWYGDCLVRFKRDKLKGKVTYTCFDSLDHHRWADDCCAGDVDNPSLAGFAGVDEDALRAMIRGAEQAEDIADFIGYYGGSEDNYFELQYHEDMLDKDCIESVTFTRRPTSDEISKLKALGIEVYYQGYAGPAQKM